MYIVCISLLFNVNLTKRFNVSRLFSHVSEHFVIINTLCNGKSMFSYLSYKFCDLDIPRVTMRYINSERIKRINKIDRIRIVVMKNVSEYVSHNLKSKLILVLVPVLNCSLLILHTDRNTKNIL